MAASTALNRSDVWSARAPQESIIWWIAGSASSHSASRRAIAESEVEMAG
jgi:hypothetical protein